MEKNEKLTRPELEQLSTSALERLLYLDFAADSETEGLDPDTIFDILEVIESRKESLPMTDDETAWADLTTRIASEAVPNHVSKEAASNVVAFSREETLPSVGKSRKKLRWIAIVAAALCIFIVPASTTGVLQNIGKWTSETFSFFPWGNNDIQGLSNDSYEELYEAVNGITDLPVLPKYFPEGSVLEDVSVSRDETWACVDASFSLGDGNYIYTVNLLNDFSTRNAEYQRDEGYTEEYYVNQIPHVIMSNYEEYTVAWRNENLECAISGNIPLDELKLMIDSMYS